MKMKQCHLFEPLIVVEVGLHGGDWTCGTPHAAHRYGGSLVIQSLIS